VHEHKAGLKIILKWRRNRRRWKKFPESLDLF